MSEWFKEHDWKSCDWDNWSGGSNPLLCARRTESESDLDEMRFGFFCSVPRGNGRFFRDIPQKRAGVRFLSED